MCGRFALHSKPEVVALAFGLREVPAYAPRYNIAPTSQVLIVKSNAAALVRWGIGGKIHNARAETVAEKPVFRNAYRKRRCLVPASGFYEWQREGARKQPWYIRPAQGELFAFAGLWETWGDLESCAVITTEANAVMRPIHDRMPVILAPEHYSEWLAGVEGLLHPCPPDAIHTYPVSSAVNSARNDDPRLLEPNP